VKVKDIDMNRLFEGARQIVASKVIPAGATAPTVLVARRGHHLNQEKLYVHA
jgi:hypothetical protein